MSLDHPKFTRLNQNGPQRVPMIRSKVSLILQLLEDRIQVAMYIQVPLPAGRQLYKISSLKSLHGSWVAVLISAKRLF